MTKKKEPHELKKRGRKEDIYDNGDLRSHLAGIKHINQLSDKAQRVLRSIVKDRSVQNNSDRAYDTKDILFLVTHMGNVSLQGVKQLIDSDDRFTQTDYSQSSVKEYKRVIVEVAKGLSELQTSGEAVRADERDGSEYYTGAEAFELRRLLDKGATKEEFEALVKKYSNRN